MILEKAAQAHVHTPKKIERKQGGVVVSEPEKEYKFVFKKRRLMDKLESLPYVYD